METLLSAGCIAELSATLALVDTAEEVEGTLT